jgi:hypothetical protein
MKNRSPKFPLALTCALVLSAAQCAFAAETQSIVGEAAMVIGVARITSANGQVTAVNRGSPIHVGDKIETESGGHVHVRFVDGGRLSVRPSSRLQVENYSYSAQQPALTAIKFKLDEGVVRSITGTWGESARDRFRLNTPVAAIGVKGTDFVVRSDADATAASVYTGAIVFAALSGGCQASLGPCQNGGEKLLSQDMKGQMLELGREQSSPRFVPLVDLLAQSARRAAVERTAKADKAPAIETGRSEAGTDKAVSLESLPAGGVAVSSVQPTVKPELSTGPTLPPAPPLPVISQMAWGRWANATAFEGDTISKTLEVARLNGRIAGEAGNGVYSLYRDAPANGSMELATKEATASFRLAGSSAQFVSNAGTAELAKVDSGSLSLDFNRKTFATQLAVSSVTLGADQISASGVVANNGEFKALSGNAQVVGALSVDAKEAGYVFQKGTTTGTVSGITLWGR